MTLRQRWEKLLSADRLGAGSAPFAPERTAFQQDYDRIVFTSAFRRLKDKTQVFPLSKSDYVRTRLTHSLEASCVGRSLGAVVGREIIARHGLTNVDAADFGAIVAAACLAHDIGNPPFGHAGEDAIREWFKGSGVLDRHALSAAERADFERYEGNAQGFRIVTRLQSPANPGLQLTSAVLATFTKYPRPSEVSQGLDGKSGKKFGYFQQDAESFRRVAAATGLVERVPDTAWRRHPLAFLVEVADDTCYLIVDLEDAARLNYVSYSDAEKLLGDLAGNSVSGGRLERLHDPKERLEYLRAKAIGRLLESAAAVFLENEEAILEGRFDDELLEQASAIVPPLQAIQRVAKEQIYVARPALEIETAGFEVLGGLLSLFCNAVEAGAGHAQFTTRERMLLKLLPEQFLGHDGQPDASPYIRLLQVADFVAGMTDSYAVDLFRKLKGIDLPA